MSETVEVAIIGAGVIGLATALRLAQAGHEVVLIDPADPGSGASYGNAGTIADYAVMPVGTPRVLRDLPRLLFDRNSPLAIRHAALASLAPWLLRFLRQSLPAAAARNAATLATLTSDAAPLWTELADQIGGSDLLNRRGAIYVYDTPAALRAGSADMAARRALGVTVDLLTAQDLATLEPALPPAAGGALFPKAIFLSDPGEMVARLTRAAMAAGVTHLRAAVTGLAAGQGPNAAVALTGPGLKLRARRVVIAAGAQSRDLARMAGERVPLDTERGYHLEWDMDTPRLSRPCCPTARGFYLCPMAGRLRVAGTVELGGLRAPPSAHRLRRLEQGARAIFPDLGPPDRSWMGFRPSIPDSVPVIGPGRDSRIIHAYGHGHIGLTLAPATARMVESALGANDPQARLLACSPMRF
jgi:D-hydroxyproline dehydrogenase